MRVALCSSIVPFIKGGARNIVEWLRDELIKEGHQVEIIYIPHIDSPDHLLTQMTSFRLLDLESSADRIICFRPPSHYIRHSNKILWFIHHIRVFYDLWDSPYRGFPDDEKHRQLRNILWSADTTAIKEAKTIFTNSRVVSDRLYKFNGIDSEVLYPPIFNSEKFYSESYGDEIVYICRIEHHKRQHLMIEAMSHTKTKVKLRLCGTASNISYAIEIQNAINQSSAAQRILFDNRWISEDEKVEFLANALAAAYVPLDEDSYGYPSLEASHAYKAVITTTDSGGVPELIVDGYNGYVCEPTPQALAKVMDQMFLEKSKTQAMGINAYNRIGELNITWKHVLDRLLA